MAAETADQQRAALRRALRQLQERHLALVQAYTRLQQGFQRWLQGGSQGDYRCARRLHVMLCTACRPLRAVSCTACCELLHGQLNSLTCIGGCLGAGGCTLYCNFASTAFVK